MAGVEGEGIVMSRARYLPRRTTASQSTWLVSRQRSKGTVRTTTTAPGSARDSTCSRASSLARALRCVAAQTGRSAQVQSSWHCANEGRHTLTLVTSLSNTTWSLSTSAAPGTNASNLVRARFSTRVTRFSTASASARSTAPRSRNRHSVSGGSWRRASRRASSASSASSEIDPPVGTGEPRQAHLGVEALARQRLLDRDHPLPRESRVVAARLGDIRQRQRCRVDFGLEAGDAAVAVEGRGPGEEQAARRADEARCRRASLQPRGIDRWLLLTDEDTTLRDGKLGVLEDVRRVTGLRDGQSVRLLVAEWDWFLAQASGDDADLDGWCDLIDELVGRARSAVARGGLGHPHRWRGVESSTRGVAVASLPCWTRRSSLP